MVVVSSVQTSRRRHIFTSILVCIAQLQLCQSNLIDESKYKLTTLPSFQIKLEIDLSKVVTGGKNSHRNNERRLSANGEGWVTNNSDIDTTNDNTNEEAAATSRPPKNDIGGSWFSNSDNDTTNEYQTPDIESSSGSWYADEMSSSSSSSPPPPPPPPSSSKPKQISVDPLSSLSTLKDALQQTNTNGDETNLSTYIRNLLVEYTTDFVTLFANDALQSNDRATRGWDVIQAIDLRGSLLDVSFHNEETHFIEDSDNHNQEESFASLIIGFSGTAAILKGTNLDGNTFKSDVMNEKGANGIQNRPIIGTNDLRLMLRAAFAPPDGPYKYLTYVLDESNSDRKDFILDKMTYEESLEHDATILLGGSREVIVTTDLKYLGDPFQSSILTFVGVGSEKAERRESISVFCEGLFLVVFIGGFYVYASHKFRRNHLKQELMKYGEGAILVKSGEKTLFSPESRAKSKFRFMTKWLKHNNHDRKAASTNYMETLEEDGYFGSESFDSNDYRDLEVGLKESYDQSNRDKAGLDMGPIDVDDYNDYSCSPSGGFTTMKAVDDDMKENMLPSSSSSRLHENVLHENTLKDMLESGVVPIPAKDDENAAYLMSSKNKSKRKKSLPEGGESVIVQRRYVQPAAPFEVLYGAAFLHGEAERVEAQRKLRKKKKKKKIRASPSGRNRVKKKKRTTAKLVAQAMSGQRSKHAVSPMTTITESTHLEEEDNDSDEDEDDFIVPVSAYSPSNFMRNLSEWVGGSVVGDEDDDEEEEEEENADDSQEDECDDKGEVDSEQALERKESDEGESHESAIAKEVDEKKEDEDRTSINETLPMAPEDDSQQSEGP